MSDTHGFHMFHYLEARELPLFCSPIFPLYLTADQILEPILNMYLSCDQAPHPHSGYILYLRDVAARKFTPFEVSTSWIKQSDEVKNLFRDIARAYKRIHKIFFIFKNQECMKVRRRRRRTTLPRPEDLIPVNLTQYVPGYVNPNHFDPRYFNPNLYYTVPDYYVSGNFVNNSGW
ncbi:7056_t:CDS:1 [Funneliformis mosseae]|uniref:7056_t:CDS:1 n=1 Tax=Funneliformis mosseae TaxID=27381 RepID=A0A9N9AXN0_FUNMO|nr:7056_t:CDS:1 [Funneliformis mosseae]